jgi:hypothetical protein
MSSGAVSAVEFGICSVFDVCGGWDDCAGSGEARRATLRANLSTAASLHYNPTSSR